MIMLRISGVLALFALSFSFAFGQTTTLTGTINNAKSAVTAVDYGNNTITLTSATGFAIGDTILIIQMQGADMSTANNSTFGDISNMNGTGNYEFAVVCDLNGNVVTLGQNMLNTYDPNTGRVQAIVPEHDYNVIVSGNVTADDWNGSTGGVMVIIADNNLTMTGNIFMDGAGFRGGAYFETTDPCGCSASDPTYTAFYYPQNDFRGANKGEGISLYVNNREAGKGKQATGGGGGNDHNAGGAGGANFGAGGTGGEASNTRTCFFGTRQYCRGFEEGIGGVGLGTTWYNVTQNRIFMGGGGGAGDVNYTGSPPGFGSAGANGGGIIIISVGGTLFGNNRGIYANGDRVTTVAQGDGSGGGGAGGTILFDVTNFSGNLFVEAEGGNGGVNSWFTSNYNCKGVGGGGGGGVVWHVNGTVPAQVNISVAGGNSGRQIGAGCNGQTNGATAGANGAVLGALGFRISSTAFAGCALLPVELRYFGVRQVVDQARIDWETTSEIGNQYFEVLRSADGQQFNAVDRVDAKSGNGASYFVYDRQPLSGTSYYKLKQVDLDGSVSYSDVRTLTFDPSQKPLKDVYPNPVAHGQIANLELMLTSASAVRVEVFNSQGKVVYRNIENRDAGTVVLEVPTQELSKGIYILKVHHEGKSQAQKLSVY